MQGFLGRVPTRLLKVVCLRGDIFASILLICAPFSPASERHDNRIEYTDAEKKIGYFETLEVQLGSSIGGRYTAMNPIQYQNSLRCNFYAKVVT